MWSESTQKLILCCNTIIRAQVKRTVTLRERQFAGSSHRNRDFDYEEKVVSRRVTFIMGNILSRKAIFILKQKDFILVAYKHVWCETCKNKVITKHAETFNYSQFNILHDQLFPFDLLMTIKDISLIFSQICVIQCHCHCWRASFREAILLRFLVNVSLRSAQLIQIGSMIIRFPQITTMADYLVGNSSPNAPNGKSTRDATEHFCDILSNHYQMRSSVPS